MSQNRLVAVSNRLADPDKPAAGGLAVALEAALRDRDGVWIGASGSAAPDPAGDPPTHRTKTDHGEFVALDFDATDYEAYYAGYANGVLWPAFHHRFDLVRYDSSLESAYRRINTQFAQAVFAELQPGDDVWIHDYHLIPLASALRALGCENRIGFFLHTPMPPVATLTAIPRHEWLMRSFLSYDLIGFQSQEDLKNFQEYVSVQLHGSVEGDTVRAFGSTSIARAFPIGIDVDAFRAIAHSASAQQTYEDICLEYSRRKLLIGVDRLDYSKGLPQRIKAFRECLQAYPETRRSATLIQVASPSRENVEAYGEIQRELEGLCGAINGDFGELDWMPVRYLHRTLAQEELAGLYRAAKVALVTPLRDGMNLVAKEFLAAQDPDDPGVLVLSRFAGAAEQLGSAVLVNPHDIEAFATAIHRALWMPREERVARHASLMQVLRERDLAWWADAFLSQLQAVRRR